MLKIPQIEHLSEHGMHYITAITKPQIESLLNTKVLQMELFDQPLAEVREEQVRYILRRNPKRAAEMDATRANKLGRLEHKVNESNAYLTAHPRAKAQTVIKTLSKEVQKLKLQSWVELKCGKARCVALQCSRRRLLAWLVLAFLKMGSKLACLSSRFPKELMESK